MAVNTCCVLELVFIIIARLAVLNRQIIDVRECAWG
jgi:hypothetical protein